MLWAMVRYCCVIRVHATRTPRSHSSETRNITNMLDVPWLSPSCDMSVCCVSCFVSSNIKGLIRFCSGWLLRLYCHCRYVLMMSRRVLFEKIWNWFFPSCCQWYGVPLPSPSLILYSIDHELEPRNFNSMSCNCFVSVLVVNLDLRSAYLGYLYIHTRGYLSQLLNIMLTFISSYLH